MLPNSVSSEVRIQEVLGKLSGDTFIRGPLLHSWYCNFVTARSFYHPFKKIYCQCYTRSPNNEAMIQGQDTQQNCCLDGGGGGSESFWTIVRWPEDTGIPLPNVETNTLQY